MMPILRLAVSAGLALLLAGPARAQHGPAAASVTVCFTPESSCTGAIVLAIEGAQSQIRVQAYYLTSAPIVGALAAAKRRGVDVAAILDRSQASNGQRYSAAVYLSHAGVPVWIDDALGIAHNKVIILDSRTVLTGSFNFTRSADSRNAENVVALASTEVAAWFLANWNARQAIARAFVAP